MSDEPKPEDVKRLAAKLTKDFTDKGLIVEAGWVGFVLACKLKDAPPDQLREMHQAFFAGAQHLFTSIMSFLDPGSEPSDKDLARMDQVFAELKRFGDDFEARYKQARN